MIRVWFSNLAIDSNTSLGLQFSVPRGASLALGCEGRDPRGSGTRPPHCKFLSTSQFGKLLLAVLCERERGYRTFD